jgi:hypothetical protein
MFASWLGTASTYPLGDSYTAEPPNRLRLACATRASFFRWRLDKLEYSASSSARMAFPRGCFRLPSVQYRLQRCRGFR